MVRREDGDASVCETGFSEYAAPQLVKGSKVFGSTRPPGCHQPIQALGTSSGSARVCAKGVPERLHRRRESGELLHVQSGERVQAFAAKRSQ